MENKSNISEISERSLSNFTHFSDETTSNISDISTSKVGVEDLNQNQHMAKQATKLEFWNTYSDILAHRQYDKGYFFARYLLSQLETGLHSGTSDSIPEDWAQTVRSFIQAAGVSKKSQKVYYKALARTCMSHCLYFADGRSEERRE
jgi:hypothetical protein